MVGILGYLTSHDVVVRPRYHFQLVKARMQSVQIDNRALLTLLTRVKPGPTHVHVIVLVHNHCKIISRIVELRVKHDGLEHILWFHGFLDRLRHRCDNHLDIVLF